MSDHRSPPIFSEISSLLAYWPLDEHKSLEFQDASPFSQTYKIISKHPD